MFCRGLSVNHTRASVCCRHREAGGEDVPQHPSLREHVRGRNCDLRQSLSLKSQPSHRDARSEPDLLNSSAFTCTLPARLHVSVRPGSLLSLVQCGGDSPVACPRASGGVSVPDTHPHFSFLSLWALVGGPCHRALQLTFVLGYFYFRGRKRPNLPHVVSV